MSKRGTVNGWTIIHCASVQKNENDVVTQVSFETQDARINGREFEAVEALKFAEVNWLFAVKFKNSEIVHALVLDRLI